MTITALPAAPSRATDTAASFSSKADALVAALATFVTETNAAGTAMTASQSAAAASAAAAAASAAVKNTDNYKGVWSSGTTYAVGQSVLYSGDYWLSNVNSNLNNTPVEGANWSKATRTVGDHAVIVHTGNGHGSTNNKIRRFTTTMVNTGTAITYADSATLGPTLTINEPGIYEIVYVEGGAGSLGVSVNSATLTTSIDSIAIATRAAYGSGSLSPVTACVRLVATDVVRPHTDGTQTDTTAGATWFSIRKVAT